MIAVVFHCRTLLGTNPSHKKRAAYTKHLDIPRNMPVGISLRRPQQPPLFRTQVVAKNQPADKEKAASTPIPQPRQAWPEYQSECMPLLPYLGDDTATRHGRQVTHYTCRQRVNKYQSLLLIGVPN